MNRAWWLLSAVAAVYGQSAQEIAQKAQERTLSKSEHYTGTLQVIDAHRKVTEKRWVFDRLGSHGDSKSILRFTAPPEVKGVALLVVNHPDRASDQWMWTPALERDRRIALQDRSGRFFGTDFSFEDLEERDVNQFSYTLLGEEAMAGVACWKLESKPKQTKASQYSASQLWIRKDNYAIVRIDHYKKGTVTRRIDYTDIENVQGIWTPRTLSVTDIARHSSTVMKIENLKYNLPMQDSDFTVEALRHAR
jgi:outer membrane lipoprotein-sorting protein